MAAEFVQNTPCEKGGQRKSVKFYGNIVDFKGRRDTAEDKP